MAKKKKVAKKKVAKKKTAKDRKKRPAPGKRRTALAKKKDLTPIPYQDSKGNKWEVVPGQPDGTFSLPGFETKFSCQDLHNFLLENVATATPVTRSAGIEDAGPLTSKDGMSLAGAPKERPRVENTLPVVEANAETVRNFIGKSSEPMTKKQIAAGTKLSTSQIDRVLKSPKSGVVAAGKSGNSKTFLLGRS